MLGPDTLHELFDCTVLNLQKRGATYLLSLLEAKPQQILCCLQHDLPAQTHAAHCLPILPASNCAPCIALACAMHFTDTNAAIAF